MNAFLLGARVMRPDVTVRSITINSWGDEFLEDQAARQFYGIGCKLLAHHTNTAAPLQFFGDHGLLAVGSNSDTRVFLGEFVLTSPMFNWRIAFGDAIQVTTVLSGAVDEACRAGRNEMASYWACACAHTACVGRH
jgi:basic membrane lipoprotein Med (substrate-binding protein (PBP1-ABC) superfamily)